MDYLLFNFLSKGKVYKGQVLLIFHGSGDQQERFYSKSKRCGEWKVHTTLPIEANTKGKRTGNIECVMCAVLTSLSFHRDK